MSEAFKLFLEAATLQSVESVASHSNVSIDAVTEEARTNPHGVTATRIAEFTVATILQLVSQRQVPYAY